MLVVIEHELTHAGFTKRKLTYVGVFTVVYVGMSNFDWEKRNFLSFGKSNT